MSNQTEPSSTAPGGYQPMPQVNQPPKNNSNKKIIIGVVVAALVLCCVCGSTAGLGTAAYFYIHKTSEAQSNVTSTTVANEPTQAYVIQPTQAAESSPTSIPATEATQIPAAIQGLGVTRAAMLKFYTTDDTFTFGQPTRVQGQELVQGENKSLCIGSNCAAVTLLGPADDLVDVSEYVPTDPTDSTQTTIALTALIDGASQFTNSDSATPLIIMGQMMQAQSAGKDFQQTITDHGYTFFEDYNAQTHNAGVTITRSK
ncbi:MAG: hypothetical protein P4L50_09735 [Anaerolineaceae bacterium]|nr:hypothetical protein [Anaerolineaceae bacterium]